MRSTFWRSLFVPLVVFSTAVSMAQQEGQSPRPVKVLVQWLSKDTINRAVFRVTNGNGVVSNTDVSLTIGDDTLAFGQPDSDRSIELPAGGVPFRVSGQTTVEFDYGAPALGNVVHVVVTLSFSGEGSLNIPNARAGRSVRVRFFPDVDQDAFADLPPRPFQPGDRITVNRDWPVRPDCILIYDGGRMTPCRM